MQIKFKKLNEKAILPIRSHEGDAGVDLTAIDVKVNRASDNTPVIEYYTGLAIEIPEGYVGLLCMRSSVVDKSLMLTNAVGIIDSGYRGEIIGKFKTICGQAFPSLYQPGERFAQLVIVPYLSYAIIESEELSETERDVNGFGSTNTNDVNVSDSLINETSKNITDVADNGQ